MKTGDQLTPKQEHFCMAFIETGNASEAYRQAYDAESMSAHTINTKASLMLSQDKIRARVDELKAAHRERHSVTVESQINQYWELIEVAKGLLGDNGQPTAQSIDLRIKALTRIDKICGLERHIMEQAKPEITLKITRPT